MAKKVKEEAVSKGKFQDALDRLNKTYGIGAVLTFDNKSTGVYDVISTGSIGFDYITLGIGGFAKGKLYELMGWEGCLTGDTFILYSTISSKTGRINCKGGSLKTLYEKFNNLPITTKYVKKRKDIQDCYFTVPSMNEEGFILHSKVKNVLYNGLKPVFELKTAMGYSIKATDNHEFYIGGSWKQLKDLNIGDTVFIHNNTTFKKENQKRTYYHEINVKYHPLWRSRLIDGKYEFFRAHRSRAVVEAGLNNMSYLEYIKFLNTAKREDIDKLILIPLDHDVHHKNENTEDDSIENLIVLSPEEHNRYHATLEKNKNNLNFVTVPDSIISIELIGEEDTYDIVCEDPFRNFIANHIVVHNSGKTSVCGHATAECQKKGGKVLYIDGEHALDKTYFQALGVDTTQLLIAQPSCGEEGFNIAMEMINTGEIDLVIIDSDSSLIPKKVLDGDVGESAIGKKALLNSNAYPKLKTALERNKTCVIVVSQYREKIGMMFGNPTTTQGGHALKFYSDCRIEISRTLAKEGDDVYGAITKLKATKNKMSPPYRKSEFEIIYGKGIDKIGEILELMNTFQIGKKYGKFMTYNEIKYDLDNFKQLVLDNEEFYQELKTDIINKIQNTDLETIIESEEE